MARLSMVLASLVLVTGCSSSSGNGSTGGAGDDGGVADAPGTADDSTAPEAEGGVDTGSAPSTDAAAGDSGAPVGTKDAGVDASTGGGEAGTMQSVEMTFYGWADNSPPGNAIAYPAGGSYPTIHTGAGGTGTYADPITYATNKSELAPGTRVYAPVIEKYLIMEDDCGQCDTDWTGSMKWHIDVWMNSNGTETTSKLLACEDQWTQNATTVEIDPPQGRTVTTAPLFDPSTNVCRTTP